MASANSDSSSGAGVSRGTRSASRSQSEGPVLCYHDEIAPLRTVKVEGPTKGRRFYGCSYYPRTCGFFRLADIVDNVRDLQHMLFVKDGTIAESKGQNHVLTEKLRKIRIKRAYLMDEVEEMGIANTETMWEIKNMCKEKKIVVFALVLIAFVVLFK